MSETPTTKTSFAAQVKQQSIDKVDLLFAIDNSASMGDKQDLLALAVPVLVGRLLNPNCVDPDTTHTCKVAADCTALGANADCDTAGNTGTGQCFVPGDNKGADQCSTLTGTKAEFPPVHDMHIGIVSSSLGPRLGDQVGNGMGGACIGTSTITIAGSMVPNHNDDQAHLLSRSEPP
ncbi:MAG TPA: hypothetical protein VGH87_11070, partial [Polyangiaceae bacterium]